MLNEYLEQLAEKGHTHNVPIASLEIAKLLKLMASVTNAEKILEIGTAIGYSTLWLAWGMKKGQITTIEIDGARQEEAKSNVAQAQMSEKIDFILGDAKEVLPSLDSTYQLIFLDSAKGQYINLLPECVRLLEPGGLLITDNVLFRGMVEGDVPLNPRYKTIVKRLRQYLAVLRTHSQLETVVLPIGDGLALSYKKVGGN